MGVAVGGISSMEITQPGGQLTLPTWRNVTIGGDVAFNMAPECHAINKKAELITDITAIVSSYLISCFLRQAHCVYLLFLYIGTR
jgi:hypothetical protein